MEQRNALIVVDVQQGFDSPRWGVRNNPACEDNIRALLAHWRSQGQPVVLVRHDSAEPESLLRPGQPGNDFKPGIDGLHDLLVTKSVNSAFIGNPDLAPWLRAEGIDTVTICGITTNHCCETTARMAGNRGFETYFVIDATHTFGRPAVGAYAALDADTLAHATAVNLHGEFATVLTTAEALRLV